MYWQQREIHRSLNNQEQKQQRLSLQGEKRQGGKDYLKTKALRRRPILSSLLLRETCPIPEELMIVHASI